MTSPGGVHSYCFLLRIDFDDIFGDLLFLKCLFSLYLFVLMLPLIFISVISLCNILGCGMWAIGINLQPRIKYNSFTVTLVILGLMKIFEAVINALIISGNIYSYVIWLPNILATGFSFYILTEKNS